MYTVKENLFIPHHPENLELSHSMMFSEPQKPQKIDNWEQLYRNPLSLFDTRLIIDPGEQASIIKTILTKPLNILLYQFEFNELVILLNVAQTKKKLTLYFKSPEDFDSGDLKTVFDVQIAKMYIFSEFITSIGIKPDIRFLKDEKVDTLLAVTADPVYSLANKTVKLGGFVCQTSSIFHRRLDLEEYKTISKDTIETYKTATDKEDIETLQQTIIEMEKTFFDEMFECVNKKWWFC